MCGVVVHQAYNQRFHIADEAVAERAREKTLLGYHDIRIGDAPDKRLIKFLGTDLPTVLPAARAKFDEFKDLLAPFGDGYMPYEEFAEKARGRRDGEEEDAGLGYDEEEDW